VLAGTFSTVGRDCDHRVDGKFAERVGDVTTMWVETFRKVWAENMPNEWVAIVPTCGEYCVHRVSWNWSKRVSGESSRRLGG
jgi:hypothetical protein